MTTFTKCRACMCTLDATVGSYDMREFPMLAHKFTTCTDLSVDDGNQVPSELCQACHDHLEQLYTFRSKCISADSKWRMQVVPSNDDKEPNLDMEKASSTGNVEEREPDPEPTQQQQSNKKNERTRRRLIFTYNLMRFNRVDPDQAAPSEEDYNSSSSVEHIYKCDVCNAQFRSEQRLRMHSRRHQKLEYPCLEPGCTHEYSHKSALEVHMEKGHSGRENDKYNLDYPYECSEPGCKQTFDSKQMLKIHLMCHAGINKYICTFCGLKMTTLIELKFHLHCHTLDRTYECHLCPKVCYSSGSLSKHMCTAHLLPRNYACRYCGVTFIQPEACNQHELIHTGEKPRKRRCCRHRQKAALRAFEKIDHREVKNPESALVKVADTKRGTRKRRI